ncbi:MAG: hypothetical protein WBH47_26590 [Streptosporangiaceae bacterium]
MSHDARAVDHGDGQPPVFGLCLSWCRVIWPIPPRVSRAVRGWLAGLPRTVADCAALWLLRVGEPFQPGGQCAWVAPATDRSGADLVLKVGFRFPGGEERDEAAGLQVFQGNGAVWLPAGELSVPSAGRHVCCLGGRVRG